MKAFWIRADTRTIEPVEYDGLADMQRMVGGYIEVAHRFPNGDILFVDEEGLLKAEEPKAWLIVEDAHQPFAGSGLITGSEDDEGDLADAVSTRDDLLRVIRFADIP